MYCSDCSNAGLGPPVPSRKLIAVPKKKTRPKARRRVLKYLRHYRVV
jgi:hypothetical protein